MTEPKLLLESLQKMLKETTGGKDCYYDTVLFPDGDEKEKEAVTWIKDTLLKMIVNKRPNADKAQMFLVFLERVVIHGYIDHILMHRRERTEDDNKKLRHTIDHLATKLNESG